MKGLKIHDGTILVQDLSIKYKVRLSGLFIKNLILKHFWLFLWIFNIVEAALKPEFPTVQGVNNEKRDKIREMRLKILGIKASEAGNAEVNPQRVCDSKKKKVSFVIE